MQTRPRATKPPEPPTQGYDRGQLERLLGTEPRTRAAWNTETVAIAAIPNLPAPKRTPRPVRPPNKADLTSVASKPRPRHTHAPRSARRRQLSLLLAGVGVALLLAAAFLLLQLHATPPSPQAPAWLRSPTTSRASTSPGAAAAASRPFVTTAIELEPTADALVPSASAPSASAARPEIQAATAANTTAAIAALARGRDREALAAYRALALAQPEKPVFAAIAAMLERKLLARCKHQLEAGASTCTASAQ